MTGTSCVILPWDSEFFGLRIARLVPERLTAAQVEAALQWGRANAVRCLYALADPEDVHTVRALEDAAFRFASIRLTLDRPAGEHAVAGSRPDVRPATPADHEPLRALARVSHRNTRFYRDPGFDPARSDEMYAIWLTKALADPDALVLVADAGRRPAGYLTLHHVSGTAPDIGIVAVEAAQQGRGLGQVLVHEALRRVPVGRTVSVVTQGENARAVRFYERCGFTVRSCRFWYHRWLE